MCTNCTNLFKNSFFAYEYSMISNLFLSLISCICSSVTSVSFDLLVVHSARFLVNLKKSIKKSQATRMDNLCFRLSMKINIYEIQLSNLVLRYATHSYSLSQIEASCRILKNLSTYKKFLHMNRFSETYNNKTQ